MTQLTMSLCNLHTGNFKKFVRLMSYSIACFKHRGLLKSQPGSPLTTVSVFCTSFCILCKRGYSNFIRHVESALELFVRSIIMKSVGAVKKP